MISLGVQDKMSTSDENHLRYWIHSKIVFFRFSFLPHFHQLNPNEMKDTVDSRESKSQMNLLVLFCYWFFFHKFSANSQRMHNYSLRTKEVSLFNFSIKCDQLCWFLAILAILGGKKIFWPQSTNNSTTFWW